MKPICLLFLALSVFAQQQPGGQQLNQYQQAADILRGAPAPATPAHRKAKPPRKKGKRIFRRPLSRIVKFRFHPRRALHFQFRMKFRLRDRLRLPDRMAV